MKTIEELKQILLDNFYDPNPGNGANPLICARCQTEYEISLKEHEVYEKQIYRLCKKCCAIAYTLGIVLQFGLNIN